MRIFPLGGANLSANSCANFGAKFLGPLQPFLKGSNHHEKSITEFTAKFTAKFTWTCGGGKYSLNGGVSQFVPKCPVLSPFVLFCPDLSPFRAPRRTNGDKTGHFGTNWETPPFSIYPHLEDFFCRVGSVEICRLT